MTLLSTVDTISQSEKQLPLSSYSFIPNYDYISQKLNSITDKSLSVQDWTMYLQNAFQDAIASSRLGELTQNKKGIAYFPLGLKDKSNEPIWLIMEPNFHPSKRFPWFGIDAIEESELLDKVLDLSFYHLSMIKFDKKECFQFMENLASLSMKENWGSSSQDYMVLTSYIKHTLIRLIDEDKKAPQGQRRKIEEFGGRIFFNTGLLDRLYKQIIVVGDKVEEVLDIPGYGLHTYTLMTNVQAFAENRAEITEYYDGETNKVPEMAVYFEDYKDVVFNAKLSIQLNDDHIYEDGVSRKRLPKYYEEYKACGQNTEERDALVKRIASDFEGALKRAKLMAQRNYKFAVPQYWRESNEIQFLLPIYLDNTGDDEKPQCALALSLKTNKRGEHYYRGSTILTLSMAYNNARLISKPDVAWLDQNI